MLYNVVFDSTHLIYLELAISFYLANPLHCHVIDRLLLDLNIEMKRNEDATHHHGYLHYTNKLLHEDNYGNNDVFDSICFNPVATTNNHYLSPVRSCYLGEVFKHNSKFLTLETVNFFDLYQYIP